MAIFRSLLKVVAVFVLAPTFVLLSCGGGTMASCNISTSILPANATADHAAAPPANQVTFSVTSNVSGVCPMVADSAGTWSTSDPTDVTLTNISAQMSNTITATCVNATATPSSISNSGTVRGRTFPTAKLTCQ